MEYIIKWKSKITGKTGGGTTRFGLWDAAEQVARLNRQFPDIEHWYEEDGDFSVHPRQVHQPACSELEP